MSKPQVVCYLSDWGFSEGINPEDAGRMDQINYAFGHIVEGRVSIKHLKNLDKLAALRTAHPHLRCLLSVGGWGADGFSQAIETAAGRDKLADSAISVIHEMRLDGIDWDWEYPGVPAAGIRASVHDRDNFTLFLERMRERLNQEPSYLLQTVAVGAGFEMTKGYDIPRAVAVLDTINLMTYDMGRDTTSHVTNLQPGQHASYSTRQSVEAWHQAGVPLEKLLIGGTFYYHIFEGVKAQQPGLSSAFEKKGQGGSRDVWSARFVDPGLGFARHWDAEAQAASFFDGKTLLSGDEEESMRAKGRFIRAEGLGGIIIWEYNQNRKGELLSALAEGLRKGDAHHA